jgi:hypothetical protein
MTTPNPPETKDIPDDDTGIEYYTAQIKKLLRERRSPGLSRDDIHDIDDWIQDLKTLRNGIEKRMMKNQKEPKKPKAKSKAPPKKKAPPRKREPEPSSSEEDSEYDDESEEEEPEPPKKSKKKGSKAPKESPAPPPPEPPKEPQAPQKRKSNAFFRTIDEEGNEDPVFSWFK